MQVRLAHEENLLFRQIDAQVAARMGASEEKNLHFCAAEVDDAAMWNGLRHGG